MGRGYIGFLQDSLNGNCAIDIMNWKMDGYHVFNSKDYWNGLVLQQDI